MTEDQPEKKSKNTVQRSTKGKKNRKNKKADKHRHPRNRKAGSSKDSTANNLSTPPLDEETVAALTLFNTYMKADRERTQHKQKIRKAENLKKNIAAKIRKLQENKGSTEELEKAKTAYREAVEDLNRLQATYESEPKRQEASESESKIAEDSIKHTEAAKTPADTKNTETAKTSEGEDAQGEASESSGKDSSRTQRSV